MCSSDLGIAGTEMIRRTVGFAHVKDLDSIENIGLRIKAKETNLLIAKELIISRDTFITGSDYINLIKRYF